MPSALRQTHLHGGRRQRRDVAADREFGPPARRQPDAVQVTIDVRFFSTAGKLSETAARLDLESERVTQPVKGVTHARADMHGLMDVPDTATGVSR